MRCEQHGLAAEPDGERVLHSCAARAQAELRARWRGDGCVGVRLLAWGALSATPLQSNPLLVEPTLHAARMAAPLAALLAQQQPSVEAIAPSLALVARPAENLRNSPVFEPVTAASANSPVLAPVTSVELAASLRVPRKHELTAALAATPVVDVFHCLLSVPSARASLLSKRWHVRSRSRRAADADAVVASVERRLGTTGLKLSVASVPNQTLV